MLTTLRRTAMAIGGSPNANTCGNVFWPANNGTDADYNIFLGSPLQIGERLSKDQCDFWDTIGYN